MRSIEEIHGHPTKRREAVPVPTMVGPVCCIEPHKVTMTTLAIPRAMDLARRWQAHWTPEHYTFNLRPGMPLWLFWTWQRRGVPCLGIVSRGQLEKGGDLGPLLYSAWDLCTETLIFDTPEQRDDACRTRGVCITTEHIIHRLSPLA